MIPVYQTIFDSKRGNCWAACIASILELSLSDVPNFMDYEDFNEKCDDFLNKYGLYLIAFSVKDSKVIPQGYHIIVGNSPRYDCLHAVVGHNGKLVHDPFPGGGGLKTTLHYEMFIIRNPAKLVWVGTPPSVIDWIAESYQWHHERSRVDQSKIHMGSSMAFRRCLKAVRTGTPGTLPIGLEIRREILMRKF